MVIGNLNNIYVFMALMLCFGVFFLFFAHHVQRYAQKSVNRGFSRHIAGGLDAFVSSTSYLVMVRGMGLIMLAIFAFLVWLAFKTG